MFIGNFPMPKALNTNSVEKNIDQQVDWDKCSRCVMEVENITSIIRDWGMIVQKEK